MEHYDGPAYRRRETAPEAPKPGNYALPPQKHVEKPEEPVETKQKQTQTYSSVDPMAQFVMPRSVAAAIRQEHKNYAAVVDKMTRNDEAVVLLADDDAMDDVVEVSARTVLAEESTTATATVEAEAEVPTGETVADDTPVASVTNAVMGAAPHAEIDPEDDYEEFELPKAVLNTNDHSARHASKVSALTPKFAPLPSRGMVNSSVSEYFTKNGRR